MEKGKSCKYKLLLHLENNQYLNYLTSDQEKLILGYPQQCLGNSNIKQAVLVSIDCQMLRTTLGQQLCSLVVIDQQQNVLIQQKIKPKGEIIDYISHITGFKKGDFNNVKTTIETVREIVKEFIKNKILIGHDLVNDLRVLGIIHKNVIDTVALLPHNNGLPNKNKLKDLSLKYLKFPIQLGLHNPKQDAVASLRLVKNHIQNGRGIYRQVDGQQRIITNVNQIFKTINLNIDRVLGFYLRGSRALGYSTPQSDYDYVLVYDTTSMIDGGLIKLFNVDIAIFDAKTYHKHTNQFNNISLIEMFFLAQQFRIIDKIPFPTIYPFRLRQSTSEQGFRSIRKSKYNLKQGNIKKALKNLLVCNRFYSNYQQLIETGKVDVLKTLPLWKQMLKHLQQNVFSTNEQIYYFYLKQLQKYKQKIRKNHPFIHKVNQNNQQIINDKKHTNQNKNISIEEFQKQLPPGELNIINYLKKYGLDQLHNDFKVKYEKHQKYNNIIQFQYMMSASFAYKIPNECRGLILDQNLNYQVVACPYFKFFDYNDKYCPLQKFDWKNSEVFEKYDGSICTLYFYDGWNVASSSKPDASGNYCFSRKQTTTVFKNEFWRIFQQKKYCLPSQEDKDKTFIFQLMSINHVIVVCHSQDRIILHGCKKSKTFEQLSIIEYQEKYNWQISKPLKLQYQSVKDLVCLAQNLNPRIQQGFIVKDKNNIRIKVKSSNYLKANFVNPINNNIIDRNFLSKLILCKQHQQFIKYCPQWQPQITHILNKFISICDVAFTYLSQNQHLQKKQLFLKSQKIMHQDLLAFIMMIKNYNLDQNNILEKLELKKFIKLLDIKPIISQQVEKQLDH